MMRGSIEDHRLKAAGFGLRLKAAWRAWRALSVPHPHSWGGMLRSRPKERLPECGHRRLKGCVFRAMPITVPRRWRSRFRTDADHDSEMMAIAIPTGSRSLFGGSRNGD